MLFRSFCEVDSDDLAVVCADDFAVVEGEDGGGVAEGEFVESFDNWEDGRGEQERASEKEGAEEFLDLSERGDEEEVFMFDKRGSFISDEVDSVAG